jgi:alpha-2-macroglobulin
MASPGRMVLAVEENVVKSETRLTLRVTPSLRGALSGGLEYLVGFPYGCTEQTMSRFFPDLLAQKLGLSLKASQAEKLPRMVTNGITRLRRMQKDDTGGWGWFENGVDDPFLTAYVLTGLATAKEQGYNVHETTLKRGRDAAAKMLDSATPRQKTFLLYALALAGETDMKRLTYPFRYSTVRTKLELDKLPPDALAYLVLLAKRIGADYRPAWTLLQQKAIVEGRLMHWKSPDRWDDMTSDRMATATALRAMMAVEPQDDKRINAVLRWLMASRTDGYFGDTRDTAWVITALCDYLALRPNESATQTGRLAVVLNGKTVKTLDLAQLTEPEVEITLPVGSLKPGPNAFELRPEGTSGTVFYAGALRQVAAAPAGGELPAVESGGITVKREILRVLPQKVGTDGWRLGIEDTKGRFQQGDRLRVRLTITAKEAASYVLIEDRFPSGCEISQRGTEEEVVESWGYWYDHVDVRDDRIAFFARKLPAGKQVIEYNLRAQTPGTSRALPTQVQGMYDAGLRAESDSVRITVGK